MRNNTQKRDFQKHPNGTVVQLEKTWCIVLGQPTEFHQLWLSSKNAKRVIDNLAAVEKFLADHPYVEKAKTETTTGGGGTGNDIGNMSTEQLQAELARRQATSNKQPTRVDPLAPESRTTVAPPAPTPAPTPSPTPPQLNQTTRRSLAELARQFQAQQ